jgi:hypothetical protein
MKLFRLTVALLLAPAFIDIAQAQQDVITAANISWISFYVGGNPGWGWGTACDNWEPEATAIKGAPAVTNAFYYHHSYSNDGRLAGGAQLGYSLAPDYEAYGGQYRDRAHAYAGTSTLPHDINVLHRFFVSDPGVSDASDTCFPYLRWGGVFTSGSRHFSGGFATRAAIHYTTIDRCLFTVECTSMNIGKADSFALSCPVSGAMCARLGDRDFDNINNNVAANIFR